jgi:outer membrane beta-barrel protein
MSPAASAGAERKGNFAMTRDARNVLRAGVLVGTLALAFAVPAAAQDPVPGEPTPERLPPPPPDTALALPTTPDTATSAAAHMNPPGMVTKRRVRLLTDNTVLRTGPGDNYALAGVHEKGRQFTVIAKSGDWYNVRLSDTETAWVHASLCKESDDMSDLEFKPNPKLFTRTGSFVLSGNAGAYAFDEKSNSFLAGGNIGYYVFDRIIVDAGLGWTHVNRPAEIVESLFGVTLEAEEFHMLFYSMNLTWEILPGRQMVPYLGGGVGASLMQGESEPSYNFGGGTTLFVSKRSAVRWEVRAYRFESGTDNSRRTNTNVAFTLGTTYLV